MSNIFWGLTTRLVRHRIQKAQAIISNYTTNPQIIKSLKVKPWAGPAFGLLSSGEKQRTLLVRTILTNPSILFLDEPMSNLDLGGWERFLILLENLAARPQTPSLKISPKESEEVLQNVLH